MLEKILKKKETVIVKQWFEHAINTYPPETAQFLKRQSDPFANPVGQTLSSTLKGLIAELIKGLESKSLNAERLNAILDPVIRIRAIQDFTPAKALSFIFFLKTVIRQILAKELKEATHFSAMLELETLIDQMGLMAFDIYMKCREKVYELKANQIKDRTVRLLKKADLLSELPETGPVIAESKL